MIMFKWFCEHEWKSHAKQKYEWKETVPVKGTEGWFIPIFNEVDYVNTVEVLICQHCGKIKKISY